MSFVTLSSDMGIRWRTVLVIALMMILIDLSSEAPADRQRRAREYTTVLFLVKISILV